MRREGGREGRRDGERNRGTEGQREEERLFIANAVHEEDSDGVGEGEGKADHLLFFTVNDVCEDESFNIPRTMCI